MNLILLIVSYVQVLHEKRKNADSMLSRAGPVSVEVKVGDMVSIPVPTVDHGKVSTCCVTSPPCCVVLSYECMCIVA